MKLPSKIWNWLKAADNRARVELLGGGLVLIVGSLWAVFIYVNPPSQDQLPVSVSVNAPGGVAAGGDIRVEGDIKVYHQRSLKIEEQDSSISVCKEDTIIKDLEDKKDISAKTSPEEQNKAKEVWQGVVVQFDSLPSYLVSIIRDGGGGV